MAKKKHTNERQIHSSSSGLSRRMRDDENADIVEQLRTEVEELRRQILELQDSKNYDERAKRSADGLVRLADENPNPTLQVSRDGVIWYRNLASIRLCRQWSPDDTLMIPPAVYEIVRAAYVSTRIIRQEMTFGEYTYLLTVAPAPPPPRSISTSTPMILPPSSRPKRNCAS